MGSLAEGSRAWRERRKAIKALRGVTPVERLLLHELSDWVGADRSELPDIAWRPQALLAADLELTRPAITQVIKRLPKKGHIEVVESKCQHRAARYRLTVVTPITADRVDQTPVDSQDAVRGNRQMCSVVTKVRSSGHVHYLMS